MKKIISRAPSHFLIPVATGFLFAVGFVASPSLALGAESALAATPSPSPTVSSCATPSATSLSKTLSDTTDLRGSLAARKDALKTILVCASVEARDLKKDLESLSLPTTELKNQQTNTATQLQRSVEFYDAQAKRIDDLGVYATKEFARSLKEWRAANYAPAASSAYNFIIWNRNQTLFAAASNRFTHVSYATTALKIVDNDTIQSAFEKLSEDFSRAKDSNAQAQTALSTNTPPDATLALIKRSLRDLSQTYQDFFELSDAIQTVIPQ